MKAIIACILFVAAVSAKPSRTKREAFDLPDGADLLVGNIRTSFSCPQNGHGYYADIENNCQIFHVCNTVENADGTVDTVQYSFLCGNQTVFNQFSFTCASPEEAIPCSEAAGFFYLNDNLRLGDPKVAFLDESDVQRAAPLLEAAAQRFAADLGRPARG